MSSDWKHVIVIVPAAIVIALLAVGGFALLTANDDANEEESGRPVASPPAKSRGEGYVLSGEVIVRAPKPMFGPSPDPGVQGVLSSLGASLLLEPCQYVGTGYSDIREGAPVTIRDEGNRIIGTGVLNKGLAEGGYCSFSFKVSVLPKAKFYSMELTRRGQSTYSFDQLEAANWKVQLTLQGP